VLNVAAFTGMPQLYADGDGDVAHEFYVEADTGRLERVHQGLRAVELDARGRVNIQAAEAVSAEVRVGAEAEMEAGAGAESSAAVEPDRAVGDDNDDGARPASAEAAGKDGARASTWSMQAAPGSAKAPGGEHTGWSSDEEPELEFDDAAQMLDHLDADDDALSVGGLSGYASSDEGNHGGDDVAEQRPPTGSPSTSPPPDHIF